MMNEKELSTKIADMVKAENNLNSDNIKILVSGDINNIAELIEKENARHCEAMKALRDMATRELLIPYNIHLQF